MGDHYFDWLADFIEECCEINPYTEIKAGEIYDSFSKWWEKNISKKVLSQKKFGEAMTKRFRKRKSDGIKIYCGIQLKDDVPEF